MNRELAGKPWIEFNGIPLERLDRETLIAMVASLLAQIDDAHDELASLRSALLHARADASRGFSRGR